MYVVMADLGMGLEGGWEKERDTREREIEDIWCLCCWKLGVAGRSCDDLEVMR